MTEEDRKLTVETETVEAPVANNLLLSNNNVTVTNPNVPSASTSTSPLHREAMGDAATTASTTNSNAVLEHNVSSIDNNLMDADALPHNLADHWHPDINRAGTSMSTSDIPMDLHSDHSLLCRRATTIATTP